MKTGVTSSWAWSEQLETSLKMRYNTIVSCDETVVFQRDEPCTNHKNTSYISTVSYLILIHLWSLDTYKIYLLPQVWNENTADNQHNLGKLGRVKSSFIWLSMEGDCNVYALFAVNAPIIRMVYVVEIWQASSEFTSNLCSILSIVSTCKI